MKEVLIDCKGITEKDDLIQLFAKHLHFPDWFGGNMDALYDCLTDLEEPTHVILHNYAGPNTFREALLDAADTDLGFSITIE